MWKMVKNGVKMVNFGVKMVKIGLQWVNCQFWKLATVMNSNRVWVLGWSRFGLWAGAAKWAYASYGLRIGLDPVLELGLLQ